MSDDFDIGFLMGLLVGEGSFTGDKKTAAVQVRMHTIHQPLLQHMQKLWGGRLNGPYEYEGRHSVVWMIRGNDLLRLLVLLDSHLHRIPDEKLHKRWRRLKKRYSLSEQFELLGEKHGQ